MYIKKLIIIKLIEEKIFKKHNVKVEEINDILFEDAPLYFKTGMIGIYVLVKNMII